LSVRVRYAPSPTGFQHIGGARTALYNYLFARSQGGKFILRIEDTDRTRFVPEALQDFYDTLAWLGIRWDEGPDVGGAKGPYVQSERLELYRKYADELIEKGFAYCCYCTSERLEKLREKQAESKSGTGYDRHCRALSGEERSKAEAQGTPYVIRLKVPLEGGTAFKDVLLGEITVENKDISPDPVMIKSDGFPTYHMANVVDDHLMEITHIMRAQEWLASAPLHVIIYRAFGWEPPALCHLPIVMGKDGHKLSKRHGATNIRDFRAKGYLPEALVNYIALVGWSYDDSREFFTLKELEELFSLDKINRAPAVFDYQKLDWFNGNYIRKKSPAEFAELVRPVLENTGMLKSGDAASESILSGLAPLIQERVKLLIEVPDMVRYLFQEPAAPKAEDLIPKKVEPEAALSALVQADELLAGFSDSDEENEKMFRDLSEKTGLKMGDLLMPVRVAVTGSKVSPPLFPSIRLLGREKARARTAGAISILKELTTRR
jgi:glutamyl-tRNA synthetase